MIRLTRLNDSEIYINALLIEQIEATPDTVVTLTNGRHLVVREGPEQIRELTVAYLGALHNAAEVEEHRATPVQWGRLGG